MLEGRLRDRVNRQYQQSGEPTARPFFIDQYILKDDGKATVWCDGNPLDFNSYDECNSWINLLEEIPGVTRQLARQRQELSYQPKIGQDVLSKLSEITMLNIEKLQGEGGAKFIPQAQQINKEVNTMIDLAKTELEIIKTIRKG